ncbi:methyltransferase [Methylomicrobium sp. Wu6]|uniref:methyltransferase n=1 Tax=Methylomicrobium sp. Wu6 TaxID=3107928 RepID=UPI002DD68A75|nr:methyltransferase [Methylomicrobium sp. Wu6]MEC4750250.1 methyltransferase [Methylomicrobium sp. Wu6]
MQFTAPQGVFELIRLPLRSNELLQPFDAADEYLLAHLAEQGLPQPDSRVLIMNDSFGTLAVALSDRRPAALSDSFLSRQATQINLERNGKAQDAVRLLHSFETLPEAYDLVLIKVPKTLGLLEHQLISLRGHLQPDAQIVLAGMVKTLPASVWQTVERLLGPTTTSLARKKAKLIFAKEIPFENPPPNPYPVRYRLEHTDFWISNHANVFSRDSLDIGTRFFLEHLPSGLGPSGIVDLGCGNGVVGLIAAQRNPEAMVHFVDESYMAVASAQENFEAAFGTERKASFQVGDGLKAFEAESADLILCNPPFHQQYLQGDQIAVSLFRDAKRVLRQNGELWVIGNRHLHYHVELDRLFGGHRVVAANPKFVIFRTRKKR